MLKLRVESAECFVELNIDNQFLIVIIFKKLKNCCLKKVKIGQAVTSQKIFAHNPAVVYKVQRCNTLFYTPDLKH